MSHKQTKAQRKAREDSFDRFQKGVIHLCQVERWDIIAALQPVKGVPSSCQAVIAYRDVVDLYEETVEAVPMKEDSHPIDAPVQEPITTTEEVVNG